MGPEFRRNIWLELAPRRLVLAAVLLSLAFFAAALSESWGMTPASAAEVIYYLVVVIWGARNAALSVVSEIRDRTWDAQRLSALTAGEMIWGKLFGATIYNWYVGGICLALMLVHSVVHNGPLGALIDLVYFIAIGVIAQAMALLASLVAVRRRQSHTRGEIFLYQLAGILAAIAVYWVWETANPAGSILAGQVHTVSIVWWGEAFGPRPFLLVSLALFTAWTLLGCYRQMRLELKLRNGPLIWLGFLIFIGLYAAGFDGWLSHDVATNGWDVVALRLGLAASTFATLTYIMVLLEPKDRVHFRWLGAQLATGRVDRVLWGLDGFMMSYIAAILTAVALIGWRFSHDASIPAGLSLVASGMGFLTRDIALFVLLHTLPGRQRGDFMAVVLLFALYALIPSILNGLGMSAALVFFYPRPSAVVWIAPAIAWAEAFSVAALALARIALNGQSTADSAA